MIFSSNGESFEDSFHHAVSQFDLSHESQGAGPELPDDPNRFRQDPDTGMWNRETATDRKKDYVTDMSSKVATSLPQADVDGIVKYIQQSPPSENVEDRRQFDPSQQFMIDNKAVPYKAAPDDPSQNAPSEASKLAGEAKTIPGYQTWPEKAVNTIIAAFKLPGDVYQGKEDPMSDKGIGRAAELAGALIFGPAPVAAKVVDGTLGSIAGITAKIADREALSKAQKLVSDGASVEDVFKQTGWYQGFEGRWRFELPTEGVTSSLPVKLAQGENKPLNEVLNFPKLFEAYPALKDVRVSYDKINAIANYEHMPNTKAGGWITVNPELLKLHNQDSTQIILHEVQHAIQASENFLGKGTSPAAIKDKMAEVLIDKVNKAKTPEEQRKWTNLAHAVDSYEDLLAHRLYLRNPGEIEARVVEQRYATPELQKFESPAKTSRRVTDKIPLAIPE